MATVRVLRLDGEIDICRKAAIRRELGQVGRFGRDVVTILDMTDVGYADTTLVNALLRLQEHVLSDLPGSRVCIVAEAHVRRLLEITALDGMFSLFDSMSAAQQFARSHMAPDPSLAKVRFETDAAEVR